mgnify:CR=1 FL=1
MKQVILVRHAKAAPYGYDDDFNRQLTDRGKNDAKAVSCELAKQKIIPDLIISSTARRAKETATIYAESLNYQYNKIIFNDELYHEITTNDFIEMLHQLPEEVHTVFVFGHNPTIYYLAGNLINFFNNDMPTCSTVGISFNIENWKELEAHHGQLDFHLTPHK